jgi:hypothetical protein
MLDVPTEIAAIVKTKAIAIAIEGLGHDPLRAVGALLLEFRGLPDRIRPRTSNVFRLAYRRRLPEEAWAYFQRAAQRLDQETASLWRRAGSPTPSWPSLSFRRPPCDAWPLSASRRLPADLAVLDHVGRTQPQFAGYRR